VADVYAKSRAHEGEIARLSVTAPALAAEGSLGFHRFEISLEEPGELTVRWFQDRNGRPDGDHQREPQREVLLSGVKSWSISYLELIELGNGQIEPHWLDSWLEKGFMPALVRIRVLFKDGERRSWPELMVAPRITTDANCVFDVVSQMCRITS
jgi:general secretion pathway protein J